MAFEMLVKTSTTFHYYFKNERGGGGQSTFARRKYEICLQKLREK